LGVCQGVFYFFSRFLLAPKFLRVVSYPHPKVEILGSVISPLDTTNYNRNFLNYKMEYYTKEPVTNRSQLCKMTAPGQK
jgi:hypothetical protein